jgi:ligand-binding SRPBCC domain-containing protein
VTLAVHRLDRRQRLDRPIDEVFAFFAQAHNLERITPSWLRFEVRGTEPGEMGEGTLIHYRLRLHGVPLRWTSRIESWDPGRGFVDRQVRGPYRVWHHRHSFAREGDATVVGDEVHYALPLARAGELAHRLFVRRDLERIFDHRQAAVRELLGP